VADFYDFYSLASQLGLQDFAGKASHASAGCGFRGIDVNADA
jgi:hypothetical protein